jgi:hypothetical protein
MSAVIKSASAMLSAMGLHLPEKVTHHFDRDLLPAPATFWAEHGITLTKKTGCVSAKCIFHPDNHASLNINVSSGGFVCFACGAKGGDVLTAHRLLTGDDFVLSAKALGAWSEK